jgi:DNA (cytosine-5)-methyltransferase 1
MKSLKTTGRLPKIVVLENVVGLLTINGGEEFKAVIAALDTLGMRAGAIVVDARHFLPQSRQRVFIVAVSKTARVADELVCDEPHPTWHPDPLVKAVLKLSPECREQWMWFNLGAAPELNKTLNKIVSNRPVGGRIRRESVPTSRLPDFLASESFRLCTLDIMPISRRVSAGVCHSTSNGKTVQRTEICVRGLAGCLRTPKGGGSRPRVIVVKGTDVRTRLLAPAEAASLMGLKSDYQLPEVYEYAFRVVGDGVAVPVVSFLRAKLLNPLLRSMSKPRETSGRKPKRTPRASQPRSVRDGPELRV